jgi:predicted nucleic acid-binding protein
VHPAGPPGTVAVAIASGAQASVSGDHVGALDDRGEADLRRLLLHFDLLRFDATADFDAAARIYRRCRRAGVTPRGMIDCMITAVAWRAGASVLAWDADFDRVARLIGVDVDDASLRA